MIIINATSLSIPPGTTWATWNGDEGGWGDTTNNHLMVVDGGFTEDEIGQGVVSGVDLVWTENGNIAATNEGKRYVDFSATHYFTGTQTLVDTMLGGGADYTWLFQLNSVSGPPSADGYFFYLTGTYYFYLGYNTTGNLLLQGDVGGAFLITTTGTIPTSDDVWLGCWCDSTTTYCGFTQSGSGVIGQPTKLSDFAANDRASIAQDTTSQTGFTTKRIILGLDAARTHTAYIKRAALSKLCLIDNAA